MYFIFTLITTHVSSPYSPIRTFPILSSLLVIGTPTPNSTAPCSLTNAPCLLSSATAQYHTS